MKILLDTNFLIAAVRFKVDVFRELRGHQLYLIVPVRKELEKLSKGRGRDAKAAKLALEIVAKKRIRVLKRKERSADRALVAASSSYAIATQDRELRKRVKTAQGKVLYIRQKKYVVFD